jgi:hypothetical protein
MIRRLTLAAGAAVSAITLGAALSVVPIIQPAGPAVPARADSFPSPGAHVAARADGIARTSALARCFSTECFNASHRSESETA